MANQKSPVGSKANGGHKSSSNRIVLCSRRPQVKSLQLTLTVTILMVLLSCSCQRWSTANGHSGNSGDMHRRLKRSLYELPAGAELLLGPSKLRSTFTCDNLGYGYYADQDNDCKIFHVCQSFRMSDGSIYNNHWSFICGNQTVFNQVSLSCSHPEEAIPCESSKDFYYVNDYFGDLQAPSVREADLDKAQELVSRAYGSRLSS